MTKVIGSEALIPNPALKFFEVLVGEWKTTGMHPLVPGKTFHGRTSFEWIEGGAYLMMRSEIDEPEIPSGVAIFGSDDSAGSYSMLYFDERGVSRMYKASLERNTISWWRDSEEFSQRMVLTIQNEKTMSAKGEMNRNGGAWEGDLELSYVREK